MSTTSTFELEQASELSLMAWNGHEHYCYELKAGRSAFTPSSEFMKDIFGPEFDDWQGITFVFDRTTRSPRKRTLHLIFNCETEGIKRIQSVTLTMEGLEMYCDRELIVLGDL